MGAWGEGMQASDTAWDAIGGCGFDVNGSVPKKTLAALKKKPDSIKKYFKGWEDEPMGVLGIAEYLLDSGVDLSPVKNIVEKALKEELSNERLDCWVERDARKDALHRFRDRLHGKKVDMNKVAGDNEGLLSRMARMMGKTPLEGNKERK